MIARALDDSQMVQVATRMAGLGAEADLVDSSEEQQDELRGLHVESE